MTDDAIAKKPREDLWSRLFPCNRNGTLTIEELYYIVRAVEAYEPSQDALRLCECELTTYRALSAQANSEAWNGAIDAARAALTLSANSLPEKPPDAESQPTPDPEPDIHSWWEQDFASLDARGFYAQRSSEDSDDECPMFGPFPSREEAVAAVLAGGDEKAADVPIVTASADPSIADFMDPDGSMRDAGILSESDVPIVSLDDAITRYCEALTLNGRCADSETISYQPDPRGRKFTRIVRTCTAKTSGTVTSQSVHAFVKREDGTIWKAAGWKAPALNFPRGSVYEPEGYATHLHGYGL